MATEELELVASRATPDDVDSQLVTEREARARAEASAAERELRLTRLEADLRDLAKLRDNFHALYKEERELRAAAEQLADQRTDAHDKLEMEVNALRSQLDRQERQLDRLRPTPSGSGAPVAGASAAAAAPADDALHLELEHELGTLRAHAADLEVAISERSAEIANLTRRAQELERDLVVARSEAGRGDGAPVRAPDGDLRAELRELAELAELDTLRAEVDRLHAELAAVHAERDTLKAGRESNTGDLADARRRAHDLQGELAVLRAEHDAMRSANDRLDGIRSRLEEQLTAERAQRAEAERIAAEAGQRAGEAMRHEADALALAAKQHEGAERAALELEAARASVVVLEQRILEAEQSKAAADQRIGELDEELSFVRSSVLTGRAEPSSRRPLLRRRGVPSPAPAAHPASRHETNGAPLADPAPAEPIGVPEDIEQALNRRLFGGS